METLEGYLERNGLISSRTHTWNADRPYRIILADFDASAALAL